MKQLLIIAGFFLSTTGVTHAQCYQGEGWIYMSQLGCRGTNRCVVTGGGDRYSNVRNADLSEILGTIPKGYYVTVESGDIFSDEIVYVSSACSKDP